MKLYRALGKIQVSRDFLVSQALHQAGKDFFFPSCHFHLAAYRFARFQKFIRPFLKAF